jgi:hypothetical protein
MKNLDKLIGNIVIVVLIALSMVACDSGFGGSNNNNGGNTNPGGPNSNDTANINAFESWLLSQPANTAETAYTYKLNVSSLAASGDDIVGPVGAVLKRAQDRYVKLDLSGSTFTSVGNNAFRTCFNLTGVTLPNSVKSIGNYAFSACLDLTSLNLPNGVTSIGDNAFSVCGLTSLTLPNSVTRIGKEAFFSCPFTSFTIPNSVTSIGDSAFWSCMSLASVTIGTGITSFGQGAFNGCLMLSRVTFQGPINSSAFRHNLGGNYEVLVSPFYGDLLDKFYSTNLITGTPGTYTTTAPVNNYSVWTKQ